MIIKSFLKIFRKILLRDQREKNISLILIKLINELKPKNRISILDYGSGYDPLLIKMIVNNLCISRYIKAECFDFYTSNQIQILNKEKNIIFRNLSTIKKNKQYDFAIIIDVLHHIGIDNSKKIIKLIKNLKKKAKFLIIKDHFEWSSFSRLCLRFMDFIGNYHNNINIPKEYYSKEQFENLLKDNNLFVKKRITNVRYHSRIFFFLSNPRFHFIYII
jgi:hypothetical protein